MTDWEIKKSEEQCFGTGNTIGSGEEYFAALVETEEGLCRRDYCVEYWEAEELEVYCFWKTRLPEPDQKKAIFIDDEMLMSFFERLAEETDEEKVNFRFVLALILMRKRRLKYESTNMEGDRENWRLKVTGQQEFVEVFNPHINEEQIEQLSSQIGNILQVEL